MEQWQTEALQKRSDGVPWAEITRQLRPVYFPELEELKAHNKIRDFVRVAIGTKGHAKAGIETAPKPEVVGVIGDTHFPFAHPNYINFLQDTFEHYGGVKSVARSNLFKRLFRFATVNGIIFASLFIADYSATDTSPTGYLTVCRTIFTG